MAKKLINLYAEDGANIIDDDATAVLSIVNSNASTGIATSFVNGGNATVAVIQAVQSGASGVFMDFVGGVLSTASINMTAAQSAGYVRVHINGAGGDNYGYIPIFKGVV